MHAAGTIRVFELVVGLIWPGQNALQGDPAINAAALALGNAFCHPIRGSEF